MAAAGCAAGCSSAQQAPAEQAKPAEPAAPAVDVAAHMHEHLARVTTMQEAVIRGDIEAAVEQFVMVGATLAASPMDVGEGIKVARVADPFGNVIGLIENPHFSVGR